MNDMKVNKNNKKRKKQNKGFYLALAICVIAIGGAAWTTYSSVLDYQTPKTENSDVSSQKEQPADKTISGVPYEESSKKPTESGSEPANDESSKDEESSNQSKPSDDTKTSSEPASKDESSEVEVDKTIKPPIEDGKVIKNFSHENPLYSKTMGDWRVHNGIDIAASDGSTVTAITSGTVKKVYNDQLLGYTVEISHVNGITVYYSGLSPTTSVKEGDTVEPGTIIGAVYTVPSEILDEPHLHLGATKDGKWIDPQAVITQNEE